jgi:hypothetical protein
MDVIPHPAIGVYACCETMDELAGDVIEQLPVGGREEDVLPVVTAQHGVIARTGT